MASIPTYVREEDWAEEQTREFRRRTRNLVYGTELGEEPPVARGQAQPSGGTSLTSGQVPSTGSGQVLSHNTPIEDDVARFREATRALNFGGLERQGQPEEGGGLGRVPDPVESFRMFVSKLPPFSIAGAVEKGAGTETTQPSSEEIGEQMRARLQARVEQANPITGIERSLEALQRYGIEPTTELAYGPLLRGEVQLPQGPGDIGPFAGRLALHTGQRLGQGIDWLKLGEQWREETPEPAPGVKGVLEMLGPVGLIGPTEAQSLAKGARALVKGAGPLTQRLATQAPEALADLSRAVKPLVPALSVEDVSKALPEGALTKFDTPEIIAERARQRDFAQTILDTSQERAALRQSIADQLYGTGAVKKEKRADIVLGPPAAGKSSVVTTPLAKEHGSLIIDADMAKELLPEFEGGRGAGRVHQESAQIAEELLLDRALENGDNVVLPLVGKNSNKIRRLRDVLVDRGYEVHLHLVDLPAEKAAARAVERFEQTGRFVDPHYVLNIGDSPAKTYDIIKSEGGIASYERFSNDVPRGQAPILVERSGVARGANALDQRGGQVSPLRRTGRGVGDQNSGAVTPEASGSPGSTPEVIPTSPVQRLLEDETGPSEGRMWLPTRESPETQVAEPASTQSSRREPPQPPIKTSVATETLPTPEGREGFAGNIRLAKYPEEVRDVIQNYVDTHADEIETYRRGVRSDEQVMADARALVESTGGDFDKLVKRWKPGQAWNAEEVAAIRGTLRAKAEEVLAAQKAIQAGGDTSENLLRLRLALEEHAAVQKVVHGVTAEAGRALRQFRRPVAEALRTGDQAQIERALKYLGGRELNEEIARAFAKLDMDNPDAVYKFIRDVTNPKLNDYIVELFYNSILSGPKTHIVNAVSNALTAIGSPVERVAAAWRSPTRAASVRYPTAARRLPVGVVPPSLAKGWVHVHAVPLEGQCPLDVPALDLLPVDPRRRLL